ncbi:hypothetical protein ACRAQ7_07945 [Erythrobacter sp. W53]|uniref:hypothetical protein n=1 Tax=Erythrobacteraceae TaxID=335929 RepID=UPI0036D416FF
MSFWTAAVIVVAIWGLVQLYTRRHDKEMGITRDEDGNPVFAPPKEDEAAKREVEELRERIKVLERIATDNNSIDAQETKRIAAEIDALRDKQD